MVIVPFEVELAKKITNNECEGKIITRDGRSVRILCFDRKSEAPIVSLVLVDGNEEGFHPYTLDGRWKHEKEDKFDLMLEIPEYMTFKDGDILICECGSPFIYKDVKGRHGCVSAYVAIDLQGKIFFDIKDWTYSIKGRADEAQCEVLIDSLKASKEPKAKEYLKRFFGIEQKQDCEFNPKDWILCRCGKNEWTLCQFSHINKKTKQCVSVNGLFWDIFIPYNDQTAHLLGTDKDWEE